MTTTTTLSACPVCGDTMEETDETPLPWMHPACRSTVESPQAAGTLDADTACLWCPRPVEPVANAGPECAPYWCRSGHGYFFAAELRSRDWVTGRTARGTPDFGRYWPVVRRLIEIELWDRFDGDLVAVASVVGGFGEGGGR